MTDTTQQQTPPRGWSSITIDLVVNGTTEFASQVGKTAQDVIYQSLKTAGSVAETLAGGHAYVAVSTLRMGGPLDLGIRLTVAVDSGSPDAVAKLLFETGVGFGVGAGAGWYVGTQTKNPWVTGTVGVGVLTVATKVAGDLWDSSISDTPVGEWSKDTVAGLFDLHTRVVSSPTEPTSSPDAQTTNNVVTTDNNSVQINNNTLNKTTTISEAAGQSNSIYQSETVNGVTSSKVVTAKSSLDKLQDLRTEYGTNSNTWTIGTGATIDLIAAATGTEIWQIQAANPGVNVYDLQVGQTLNLPSINNGLTVSITTSATPTTGGATSETPISSDNSTLIDNGVSRVLGVGNVNSATGVSAMINDIISDGYRPGNQNLSPNQLDLNQVTLSLGMGPIDTNSFVTQVQLGANALNNSNYGLTNFTPTDPLVLDLNGDGVKLTDYSSAPVLFDIDHDGGSKEQTGWVSAADGIVVYDLNNNGKIDDISETLSEYFNGAVGSNGNAGQKKYTNGLAALKSLDSNADNQFTSADAAWNSIKVWVDDNHDGKSWKDTNNNNLLDAGEQSELKTLNALGITSINLNTTTQSGLVRDGNEILASSSFVQNGQTKEAIAANFIANPNGSTFTVSGSGTLTTTENGNAGSIKTYTAANPPTGQTTGESIDVTQKGVNNAMGGTGNDTLIGDAANNWLAGGLGADTLNAGAGDDVLLFDSEDTIDGGAGNDVAQVIGDTGVVLNLAQSHVEVAIGGRGDDILIGGGRSSVFIKAGDGDDIVIGGAANDVLSGENGADLIDGGAGNDLIRGHRGRDQLMGGAGDDILDGGQDDDCLSGGDGNDVLTGGQGDDVIDGGAGVDVAQYSGSVADYRIIKLGAITNGDGTTSATYRIVDTKSGGDGADTLTNIEKLSFSDVVGVDITLDNPMPVKDVITLDNRTGLKLIKVSDLLANDRDWQNDALHITTISDLVGGSVNGTYNSTTKEWTPTLTANGELQFTPDANYKGVMSFKYKIADVDNTAAAQFFALGSNVTAELRGQVILKTPDMPTDPLFTDQWYLNDINVTAVWNNSNGQGYTGKGVNIAQFEPGGAFSTGPEVFDTCHSDLKTNVDQRWLADPNANIPQTFSNHATLVAGVMVAARNGEGGVGVAYDAKLSGHYFPGDGLSVNAFNTELRNALAQFKNYDVVNNSWGSTSHFGLTVTPADTLAQGFLDAITQGRNGLGTAIVMAGGNDRQNGGNTNYNALTANRAAIVTGAINAQTDLSTMVIGQKPFSNPGASILVSAPGSNIASTSRLIEADNGSTFGSDVSNTQGTSFATPIVSGIVALMLEANPNLGWRDIQQILAITARKVNDPTTDTVWNTANNWNGGGMHTSHDYGLGDVDARAAVRLAETWQGSHTSVNERTLGKAEGSMNGAANLNIAINDGATVTRTLVIGAGIRAEHVTVTLDVTHSNWGDLTVELISPTGTVSKLINNPGTSTTNPGGDVGNGRLVFGLDTTHDLGENAQGNWQLRITDRAGRGTGTLNGWKVDVFGSDWNETLNSRDNVTGTAPVISTTADNQYYYTDEFGSIATAPGTARQALSDTNGGLDILNASAVSGNSTINLNANATSTIAGRSLVTDGNIEFAFGGDGNDTLTGNANSNRLQGGRGNDSLNGGGGTDLLDGGSGSNTLAGGAGVDFFVIRKNANTVDTITDFSPTTAGEKILLVGFDIITDYTQVTVTQEGVNTRLGLGNGQSILLQNLAPSQITEQNFGFFSDNAMLDKYMGYLSNASITSGTSGIENTLLPNTTGDMRYFALAGDDVIGGQTKNDLIDGGNGNDSLWGDYPGYSPTPGADWLEGGAGNDRLYGGADNDVLLGGAGYDVLAGEAGNDVLRGATGTDELYGGDGNDVLIGGAGNDYLEGGAGNDLIMLEGDLGVVTSTVTASLGNRVGGAGADIFKVIAGGGGSAGVALGTGVSAYNMIIDFNPNQAAELIDLTDLTWIRGFADLTIRNNVVSYNGVSTSQITASDGTNQLSISLNGVNASALNASHFKFTTTPGLVFGTGANDTLTGDAGGNTLDGKAGADAMTGRTGDDTYIVDNAGDMVNELPDGGYDAVQSSVTYTLADNVEQLTLTGTAAMNATGNDDANRIVGNSGNNVLDGNGGSDDLVGKAGDDTYIVDVGTDRITENANEGTDTVQSSVSWTLGQNLENLTLTGADSINATGNTLNNVLTGNAADNVLDGAQGADSMAAGAGDDTYFVDNAADTVTENLNEGYDTVYSSVNLMLGANLENLVLFGAATSATGNELNNTLIGNATGNMLIGGTGNDVLIGLDGSDTMVGGLGDDAYTIDVLSDVITENANEGTDLVNVAIATAGGAYTLTSNLENATLTNTVTFNLTGNDLNNMLTGNAASNILDGGTGADTLDGVAGADIMIGGSGNDTYVVDNTGDVITENLNEGTDLVQSYLANYMLAANVENLTLMGSSNTNGTGNLLNNVITGNAANNILNGYTGNDTLIGGAGDDTLDGAVAVDLIRVFNQGNSAASYYVINGVNSALLNTVAITNNIMPTYKAGQNVEIRGSNNVDMVYVTPGSSINFTLSNSGVDCTYLTGNLADYQTTVAGASITFTRINGLSAGQSEIVKVYAGSATNYDEVYFADGYISTYAAFTRLVSNQPIILNTSKKTGIFNLSLLPISEGADTLIGSTDNDTYVVDNTGDIVTENLNEGTDLVQSYLANYMLAANVENLTLMGYSNTNGTGNALNNVITGNAANNLLDGGAGADTMVGSSGNDTYVVDNAGDVIIETSTLTTEIDTVQSKISYTLGANVENLTLTGTTAINGTGNTLNNAITGNSAANILNGGLGNDILVGGLGNDTFAFNTALSTTNVDTISDFLRGADKIGLSTAIFTKLLGDTDLSDNLAVGATGVKALDANDYLIYDNTTKALYYDADGSGAGAAIKFATLQNITTLNASDFVLM